MGEWITAKVDLVMPEAWTEARKVVEDLLHDRYDPEPTDVDGIIAMSGYIEANYGDTSELTSLFDQWGVPYRTQHDGKYEIPGEIVARRGQDIHVATCAGETIALSLAEVKELGNYEAILEHFETLSWFPAGEDATALLGHPDPVADEDEEGEG